jgi:P-type Cu+ transporter
MVDSKSPHLTLDVTGMHCSSCTASVQRALEKLVGEGAVTVNLPLERADFTVAVDVSAAIAAVKAAGYGATARTGTQAERELIRETLNAERRADDRKTFFLFVVSALFFLPFLVDMGIAMAGYGHGTLLAPYVQLALALPVQFICGWRFIKGAWHALLRRNPNMDVLVALGTLAATGFSTWRVWTGLMSHDHAASNHALYFEGAVAVITFVLLGKVLEANARSETTDAMTALGREQVQSVLVYRDLAWIETPTATLKIGEHFAVRPGQRAAADGIVKQGISEMNESLITGESQSQSKALGSKVISGALNGLGMLTVEATAVGEDATLARITRLVEAAQSGKAAVQNMADAIARIFVPVVLLIAMLTALVWWWLGYSETALIAAISVLVVSCPCALGLATPIALVAGMGSAAKAGILVRDITSLETAAKIDLIAFDKTGTLTEGTPRIAAISAPGIGPDDALKLALALSLGSEHSLANAVRDAANDRDITTDPALTIEVIPGSGVKGIINGVPALFGSADFIRSSGISLGVLEQVISRDPGFGEAQTVSWLAGAGRVIGAFAFVDGVRPYAEQTIQTLKEQNIDIVMLSGDRRSAAEVVASKLGIGDVRSGLNPAAKVAALKSLIQDGKCVAMVGDGLNDTPALAAANLGISMASGTEAARATAGITLMRPDLRLIPKALTAAKETSAVIRQNLWLAFLFNGVGIPLAALGLLTPALAGAAMAASSVSVVLNALRLSRRVL